MNYPPDQDDAPEECVQVYLAELHAILCEVKNRIEKICEVLEPESPYEPKINVSEEADALMHEMRCSIVDQLPVHVLDLPVHTPHFYCTVDRCKVEVKRILRDYEK